MRNPGLMDGIPLGFPIANSRAGFPSHQSRARSLSVVLRFRLRFTSACPKAPEDWRTPRRFAHFARRLPTLCVVECGGPPPLSNAGFLPKAATTQSPMNGLPEPDNWLPVRPDSLPGLKNRLPGLADRLLESSICLPDSPDGLPEPENTLPGSPDTLPDMADSLPDSKNSLPEPPDTLPEPL